MDKKGVELTVNTLIIIALALIVLVVIVFMFMQGVRQGGTAFFGCESRGGQCLTPEKCENGNGRIDYTSTCPNEGEKCCLFNEEES